MIAMDYARMTLDASELARKQILDGDQLGGNSRRSHSVGRPAISGQNTNRARTLRAGR